MSFPSSETSPTMILPRELGRIPPRPDAGPVGRSLTVDSPTTLMHIGTISLVKGKRTSIPK